jgi:hypothetical protein
MKVFASDISVTNVYYAVIAINRSSVVLARDVWNGIPAIIAPTTKNGQCTPAIRLGRDLLLIAAWYVVSVTVIIRDVLALYVTTGMMVMIAKCHLQEFQLCSLASVATCGMELTCVTLALFHHRFHNC